MNLLLLLVISVLISTGVGIALLGSIKVPMARKLQIDEARIGGLLATFGFTLIPVILTAGFFSDLVGRQSVTIVGSVLLTTSLILLAQATAYWMLVTGVLLLSAAWGTLINVVNPLSLIAFGGTQAYALNLGCFIFGIGSFVTPMGATFLINKLGLQKTLLLLAALVSVNIILGCGATFPSASPVQPQQVGVPEASQGLGTLLGDAVMWLCALALFFYMPAENTMAGWATTYLTDKGIKDNLASALLSGFWLSYTATRLVAAFAVPKGCETMVILVLSFASFLAWVAVVLCRGRSLAAVLVVIIGMIFGPIYPTLLAVLLGHFDPSLHGRAIGLFFTLGGLGCTVLPMMIGAYAKRTNVQRGFILAAASNAGLVLIALLLMCHLR
ncbi:MAG: MFS transporter [Kiritimatiellae bacterium]|nr:MFS transporter [Kiritimatiellia bacterium]MDD5523390.1 MFS transporter [Kiritimatiellia bacterium]